MLMILTSIFGFLAPFLPELLKFLNRRADNAHELEMLKLRLQGDRDERAWRLEEINTKADAASEVAIHAPQQSFGVQILDAAHGLGLSNWLLVPAFYAFALLDLLNGIVRPGITIAAFAGYLTYKAALFRVLNGPRFEAEWHSAVIQVWGEQDWAVLTLVLSYWFGQRAAKAAFGGNASNAKPGA